jgi:quaternary ammonium compound-resistance protein SugE
MNWFWLILAGVLEVAWSQSIKPTENFTRPWHTVMCLALAAAAVYPLTLAMRTVPVGTAYAVFVGIGAVGAITLGVLVNDDPVTPARLAALALILAGVILSHLF